MATNQWLGNAGAATQVDTFTVSGAANGATITVTINTKAITYTMTGADTNATAAAALAALLAASQFPEFLEIAWTNTPATAVITGTCNTPGLPFTAAASAATATLTQAHVVVATGPNDVNNVNNWSLGAVPVNTNDVVFADSGVSALYNLNALSGVTGTLTIWQSYTGAIGLLENNPAGYVEYRPTYLKHAPSALVIGTGPTGGGSGLMRINCESTTCAVTVIQTGTAVDGQYALRWLGTSASNTMVINSGTVGVAMLPGEVATLSTLTVQGGASATLGSGVTLTTAKVEGAAATLRCPCTTLTIVSGSATLDSTGTFTTVNVYAGSQLTWNNVATITTLTVTQSSQVNASQDSRAKTVTNSTIDGNCTITDPWNSITFTNATTINGPVQGGPFVVGTGRTIKVT